MEHSTEQEKPAERPSMVGEVVVYVDPQGREHGALVTADWGSKTAPKENSSLNLVIVTTDVNMNDQYGRQINRQTSVVHQSKQSAPAFFWKDIGE